MFLPIAIVFAAATVFVVFVDLSESDLWYSGLSPILEPLAVSIALLLCTLSIFRTLQVAGAIGVVYVRAFEDGSGLVGSWWRVRGGHGLVVDGSTRVKVQVVDSPYKTLGWRTDTGIPVYMAWTVATKGRKFSWLTPFEAVPDAADRIMAVLAELPEPSFAALETSQAARAT